MFVRLLPVFPRGFARRLRIRELPREPALRRRPAVRPCHRPPPFPQRRLMRNRPLLLEPHRPKRRARCKGSWSVSRAIGYCGATVGDGEGDLSVAGALPGPPPPCSNERLACVRHPVMAARVTKKANSSDIRARLPLPLRFCFSLRAARHKRDPLAFSKQLNHQVSSRLGCDNKIVVRQVNSGDVLAIALFRKKSLLSMPCH